MKQFISYGKNNLVKAISTSKIDILNMQFKETENDTKLYEKIESDDKKIKLAYICNWGQQCGISTYSNFIFEKIKHEIDDYKIFSESLKNESNTDDIIYCWERGKSLSSLVSEIKKYSPNFILLQHEWGIFPNATYFMSFIIEMKRLNIPVLVILHSVYEHIDKTIPLSIVDNVVVHSDAARSTLQKVNFSGNIYVISHGCPEVKIYNEVWNIFQTPYLIFGYGFGFKYKGVEVAIDSIKYLKDTDPKFKNILYIYVCSESDSNKSIHDNYYDMISSKVEKEGLKDNILLIKGFLESEMLDIYLKTVKLVIFPYVSDPNNNVFGSSGAIKIAMSYNIPVIASKSNLFSDLEGYVSRTSDHIELAKEIDKIFSDSSYRDEVIKKQHEYIENNTWDISAKKYINIINEIISLH